MYCLYIPYSSFIIALKPTNLGMYPLHEKRNALSLFEIKQVCSLKMPAAIIIFFNVLYSAFSILPSSL
jgi:hypothetical protein